MPTNERRGARVGSGRRRGLPVRHYDADSLKSELGVGSELLETERERRITPSGREQRFSYCRFRRL